MAAVHFEVYSFIEKFMHLSACGLNANVNFINQDGRITVNLQADIGTTQSLYNSSDYRQQNCTSLSRRKRRKRRRQKSALNPGASTNYERVIENIDQPAMNAVECEVDSMKTKTIDQMITHTENEAVIDPLLAITSHSTDDVQVSTDGATFHSNSLVKESTSEKSFSMNEFYNYMENFNSTLGVILEEKLANAVNGPT